MNPEIDIAVMRLPNASGLGLPAYATPGSAGIDLLAAAGPFKLSPLARIVVPTGLALAIPQGYEAQVRSRSGLAKNHGLMVLNSPGTIDSDYRGEIGVILVNLGEREFVVERGMRVAQLVVAPITRVRLVECRALPDTHRGAKGFGSTGTRKIRGEEHA